MTNRTRRLHASVLTRFCRVSVLCCCVLLSSYLAVRADVIGYWRFEGDGSEFRADSSSNDVTLNIAQGAPTPYALLAGKDGQYFDDPVPQNGLANAWAAEFDGDDTFSASNRDAFAVNDFTIEAYINKDDSENAVIAGQWSATDNQRSWALQVDTGTLELWISRDGTNIKRFRSSFNIEKDVDYFVAAAFDSDGSTTFYIEDLSTGVWTEGTDTSSAMVPLDSAADFNIGAYDTTAREWSGLIDEVRWSNTVLSKSDLLAVPEPSALVLLIAGGFGVLAVRRVAHAVRAARCH